MIGQKLAHYEVTKLLGKGGMGEVYQARDTKLDRAVALKLLPDTFARDPERLARFEREARVLASLHHPNIAAIFGLEEADGHRFLVMELAEGMDLAERIHNGPIPEDEALDIARQIAAGLEEAHEHGVVHRDLKPANIKLGSDGRVKILDFGLARAFAGETAAEENLNNSPTITAALTGGGVILGTAAYMSPEQARGKKVDRRADIWSFGVVLYEMLTGKRLFEGETISDTLAAVLRAEPDWDDLPADTHLGVVRLVQRCLERDPLKRLRDVGEARIFLESGLDDSSILSSSFVPASLPAAEAAPKRRIPVWAVAVASVFLFAGGLLLGGKVLATTDPPRLLNTVLPPPDDGGFNLLTTQPGPAMLSPDGTMAVYTVRGEDGTVRIHLRRLDSPDAVVLSGTEGAMYPFWSADSRFIGFCASDKLKKVAVGGGPPVSLCEATNMKGGSWNMDGVIIFAPDHKSGIHRVSATGGEAVAVTTFPDSSSENSHRNPRFLPDGNHFLYIARVTGGTGEQKVYVASLDGMEPKLLTTSESTAEYSEGHLLTVRENILLATPFDPKTLELGDNGVPLVEDIHILSGAACGVYSSTNDGMLLYQVSTATAEQGLEFVDLQNRRSGRIGDSGQLFRPAISPDGTQAVVGIFDTETDRDDLWLVDLESGLKTRFTFAPGTERNAIWTPDGTEVVYTAEVDSLRQIVRQPVEGFGDPVTVYETTRELVTSQVTPDGSSVIFSQENPETDFDVMSIPITGGDPTDLVQGERVQAAGRVSPDGRWLATTDQTPGELQIFVRPTSGSNRKWQVSQDGAVYPFWSPRGDYLYFIEFSGQVVRVPVDAPGSTFRVGAPEDVMTVPPPEAMGIAVSLHPDGERVLFVSGDVSGDEKGYLRLVTDWQAGLAQ